MTDMKKFSPYLVVLVVPIAAALFLVTNRAEPKAPDRDDSVSITQKHTFSAMAGTANADSSQAGEKGASPSSLKTIATGKASKAGGLRIGDEAPPLRLTALDGTSHTLTDWRGKLPLVMMADTTCPCVRAYDKRMKALAQKFPDLRVVYVFSSPLESRGQVVKFAAAHDYPWPVVYDGEQPVIATFGGRCTTESFLFDREGKLRYHGRIDDNIYDEANVKTRDLENAIQAITDGKTFVKTEVPAYGCVIPRRSENGAAKTEKGKTT